MDGRGGATSTPDGSSPAPLTYPGTPPAGPGLLLDSEFRDVRPEDLDDLLAARDLPRLAKRQPVLSVGANASPARLRRKLRRAQVALGTPMTVVHVRGLAAGVSAHVSRSGFVPATPVAADGEVSRFFVVWLDPDQLTAIDATEPNYHRVPLGPGFDVSGLEPARADLHMYASRHGCLVDAHRTPRRLTDQTDLIRSLVEESDALRALAGPTPEDWVEAMRSSASREQARVIWTTERRVSHRPLLGPND